MTFTVQHQNDRYEVIGYDRVLGSFDDELSAQEAASRWNDEYERVLEVL